MVKFVFSKTIPTNNRTLSCWSEKDPIFVSMDKLRNFLKLLIAVPDARILLESHLQKHSTEIKRKAIDPFVNSTDSKITARHTDVDSSLFDGFLAKL